jgi:hypothetical protein
MHILPHLPRDLILDAYSKAAGKELDRKSDSPESSSALVANAFGWFLDRPTELPPLPGLEFVGWTPQRVVLEANLHFPWQGGRHPWLDVLVETPTHIVGIESKRFEPYRGPHLPSFSPAFDRDVWQPGTGPYLALLSALTSNSIDLSALDAAQLVKHALALSTQAARLGKRPALLYLYADPAKWPDGRDVSQAIRTRHADHLASFTRKVVGADVQFASATYVELLQTWLRASSDVQEHARAVMEHFCIA